MYYLINFTNLHGKQLLDNRFDFWVEKQELSRAEKMWGFKT